MLWIQYFILIGIIEVSYAADDDIYCFSTKLGVCSRGLIDLCSQVGSLRTCLRNSALSCSMINDKDVKSMLDFLNNKTCKEGTPTNKVYTENWPCITQLGIPSDCSNDLMKAALELRNKVSSYSFRSRMSDDEFMRESMKSACKFKDRLFKCTLTEVMDACGKDAESFLREERNSGINQLDQRLCDYLNGVSRISIYLPIWFLQAAILIFIFKWSSH